MKRYLIIVLTILATSAFAERRVFKDVDVDSCLTFQYIPAPYYADTLHLDHSWSVKWITDPYKIIVDSLLPQFPDIYHIETTIDSVWQDKHPEWLMYCPAPGRPYDMMQDPWLIGIDTIYTLYVTIPYKGEDMEFPIGSVRHRGTVEVSLRDIERIKDRP